MFIWANVGGPFVACHDKIKNEWMWNKSQSIKKLVCVLEWKSVINLKRDNYNRNDTIELFKHKKQIMVWTVFILTNVGAPFAACHDKIKNEWKWSKSQSGY